jgi:hypothetical protein
MQEALAAWALWGLVAISVWATYARFPAAELYNVTGTGFAAGAARTLVFLSWPVAIAAVAFVVVAADRLLAGSIPGWAGPRRSSRQRRPSRSARRSPCQARLTRTTSMLGRPKCRRPSPSRSW